tara:strand:- start:938 stop:1306 length:369 start_codon:yes stop_codon:yes gene_type:complete
MAVLEGNVAFANLDEHEEYQGQSTGKYSLVLSLADADAEKLSEQGVKLREYEGVKQRKFSTKYEVPMFDAEGAEFMGRLTRGSKVRVQYAEGKPHPVHGTSTYLSKVKVLELAEASDGGGDF